MPTTQTTAYNTTQKKIKETVLNHSPLKANAKAQQECWANFGVSFQTQEGRAFLQPGQFLPVWQLTGNRWRLKTKFDLSVVSAFVMNSRYMIRGGDSKMSSHPEIQDWEEGTPASGQASELRFPGGFRRITSGNMPGISANAGNYEARQTTARAFHNSFNQASLLEGCPIEIVCRTDSTSYEKLPLLVHAMVDIIRGGATIGYALPIPVISSNEEEVVLKDYPYTWTTAVMDMLSMLDITEVGVLYKAQQGGEAVEDFSSDRPQEIYRNVLNKGDLGVSTLDPDLYERMLPFATGRFDKDLMLGV